ncbi:MAG: response regulator [Phycisphaerales bacterium]
MPLDPRLLLATEDLALSRSLSWVLKENGYDVVTASGGPQLAERLDQEEYDLLVLDIGSGEAGALDRLRQLRHDPRTTELPLVVLADADVTPESLEPHALGNADLVARPHRVRELLARIKAHLRVGRELNRARAEAPFWVTASVGLATFPDDRAVNEMTLLKLADENLYRAKHAGRNRYRD